MSDFVKINRRDWLKQAFNKTKDVSLKATTSAAGNFADMSETLKEYRWENINSSTEITDIPKQIMFKGKLLNVVFDEDQIIAYRGICPIDGQLVYWQAHTKTFYCPNCEARYDKTGINTSDNEIKLARIPARIEHERIQLRID